VKIYKFILGHVEWVEVAPGMSMRACLAVVAAQDEEEARAVLRADASLDVRWLPFARVVIVPNVEVQAALPVLIAYSA
jgi:hypothetical protein